ncbi:MAG: hypothetical protein M3P34_03530 [Actinomycetota bacterium]|nr:hypothetical protein [Actinomycetota bacterium]
MVWPSTVCGTFRHLALSQPGARIQDVSRLLGHSTVRVTQDLYIAPEADLYDRFYEVTADSP